MQPTVAALFARHKRRQESAPVAAELSTAPGDRLPDTPSSAGCEARLCDGAGQLSCAESIDLASRSEQVLDFEATCNRDNNLEPQELLEVSCCVLLRATGQVVGEYQAYVRPTEHPVLTAFCTELTGITQAQADRGAPLADALDGLHRWLLQHGYAGTGVSSCPVTWTDWDLKVGLERERKWRGITVPNYLRQWINLKVAFGAAHSQVHGNLRTCVEAAGVTWEGRAHSGLDDARNTARLAAALLAGGACLSVTGYFPGCGPRGLRQCTLFPDRVAKKRRTTDAAGKWNGFCECGVRARLCTVKRPCTNLGRQFWGCGTWTILEGRGRCRFLLWKDEADARGA